MMGMLVGLALLLASGVRAEDTGAVIAALKDATAECRYLATLCARSRAGLVAFHEAAQRRTAGTISVAEATAAEVTAAQGLANLSHALDVVEAKHGTVPPCWKGCPAP